MTELDTPRAPPRLPFALAALAACASLAWTPFGAAQSGAPGIGSDFTMRSLALKTIAQARQFYPDQSHAAIFEKHFKLHGIVK